MTIMNALFIVLVFSVNMVTGEKPVLSIHGSGTTNPNKCFWHVMDKMETRAKLPLHMTYRGIGGTDGLTEFNTTPPVTYFGSGDLPIKKELYDYLSATEVVFQMPVFLSAVSFFHSIPNTPSLNLTACTLAQIFNRKITNWSHRDIASMNPALTVPEEGLPIRVARRTDGGSSTFGITQYLANACPTEWPVERVGSKIEWAKGTLECQGSQGVIDCITEEPGTIGYVDAGHGRNAGLEEVYVENSHGTKLTSLQSAARGGITGAADNEGILPEKASDDFTGVSLINQPGEFTWPITLLTYIYVRKDLTFIDSPQEQALLKAFLQALFDDSYVQQCVDAYGLYKVDGRALNMSLAAIDSLNISSEAIPFTFEDDTQVVLGAADYSFSAKRQSATEVDIDILTTANEKLTAQVTKLESLLTQTISKSNQITPALVMSIIALVLSLIALGFTVVKPNPSGKKVFSNVSDTAESA